MNIFLIIIIVILLINQNQKSPGPKRRKQNKNPSKNDTWVSEWKWNEKTQQWEHPNSRKDTSSSEPKHDATEPNYSQSYSRLFVTFPYRKRAFRPLGKELQRIYGHDI